MRLKAQYGLAGGDELATFDGTELFDHPGYDPAEDEFLASVEQGIAENGAYGNLWSLDVENLYRQYSFYKMATTSEGLLQFLAEGMGGIGEAGLAGLPALIRFRQEAKAASYWYRSTFASPEQSLAYHYNNHTVDEYGEIMWASPDTYTQAAINFYNANVDLGYSWKLDDGARGIRIDYGDYYGIYTRDGRIVSFGLR